MEGLVIGLVVALFLGFVSFIPKGTDFHKKQYSNTRKEIEEIAKKNA